MRALLSVRSSHWRTLLSISASSKTEANLCSCKIIKKPMSKKAKKWKRSKDKYKIIFLDIDGVLNCATTTQRHHGLFGMDPGMIELLGDIVEKTGADIVLTSTWRLVSDWRETIKLCGLALTVIDRTPHMPAPPGKGIEYCERGKEIAAWLKDNQPIEKYVILDDDSDMLPWQRHFKTYWKTGLTREVADKVINYLNTKI